MRIPAMAALGEQREAVVVRPWEVQSAWAVASPTVASAVVASRVAASAVVASRVAASAVVASLAVAEAPVHREGTEVPRVPLSGLAEAPAAAAAGSAAAGSAARARQQAVRPEE